MRCNIVLPAIAVKQQMHIFLQFFPKAAITALKSSR
jgi:hypothetical protein